MRLISDVRSRLPDSFHQAIDACLYFVRHRVPELLSKVHQLRQLCYFLEARVGFGLALAALLFALEKTLREHDDLSVQIDSVIESTWLNHHSDGTYDRFFIQSQIIDARGAKLRELLSSSDDDTDFGEPRRVTASREKRHRLVERRKRSNDGGCDDGQIAQLRRLRRPENVCAIFFTDEMNSGSASFL